MVNRFEKEKRCIVVDLDGTLIKGNSLLVLTKNLIKKCFFKHQWINLIQVFETLIQRKLGFISHVKMRNSLISLAHTVFSEEDLNDLANKILKLKDQEVWEFLRNRSKLYTILLSTAASEFYLPYIVEKITDFKLNYIGTKYKEHDIEEDNRGEFKLRSTEKFLQFYNMEWEYFLSDHFDDLPLFLKCPGEKILVHPTKKTLKMVKNHFQKITKFGNTRDMYKLSLY